MGDREKAVETVREYLVELGFKPMYEATAPNAKFEMYFHRRHAGQVMLQTVTGPNGIVLGWDVFVLAHRERDVEVTMDAVQRWSASFEAKVSEEEN